MGGALGARAFRGGARVACAAASAALLVGCSTLPRSGPLASQITTAAQPGDVEGLVAQLTADVVARIASGPPAGFPQTYIAAPPISDERIGRGDILDIVIWEREGGTLFRSGEDRLGGGPATLRGTQVDDDGRIYVPFAGQIRAAGATLGQVRDRIRQGLEPFTLSPEVDVRIASPVSRMISIQGAVGSPGAYPLRRGSERLIPLLAVAGGATLKPEKVEVRLRRDGAITSEILSDIYSDPSLNLALRPGDELVLSPVEERFIVLGAASVQAELEFPTRDFDLMSAIAVARGLQDGLADPTGVFLFRREPEALADALLPGPRPEGLPAGPGRPIVYRLDLTEPESFFTARNFRMRDGDVIFVTNAPLTELRKVTTLFASVLSPIDQTARINP